VRWEVHGGDTELDRGVLQQLADPLLHLVRNAVDHGIERPAGRVAAGKPDQATLVLRAVQLGSEVIIDVSDDGRGINVEAVREKAAQRGTDTSTMDDEESLHLVFDSGFSTAGAVSDVSGRGVGLDVVRAGVEAVRGRIEVHSTAGVGTEFRIVVPITLAVLSCLLVEVGAQRYALPMHSVVVAQDGATEGAGAHAGGQPMAWVGDTPVPISSLARTLWGTGEADAGGVVVVVESTRRHAFLVDRLVGQRDVVVKGLSRLLPRVDVLAGASVEPNGSILLVLDVAGLVDRARAGRSPARVDPAPAAVPIGQEAGTLLVVDDAAVVRQLQQSILERAGYQVLTANDGAEALLTLAETPCDLVLTDVEMPRMDGFALTEAIRADATLANTPVLVITASASEESRQRGLEAGADGYIVKSAFDESALLAAIERLLGARGRRRR
jgi:two-component system chemotaxis sensor kinase CheA